MRLLTELVGYKKPAEAFMIDGHAANAAYSTNSLFYLSQTFPYFCTVAMKLKERKKTYTNNGTVDGIYDNTRPKTQVLGR